MKVTVLKRPKLIAVIKTSGIKNPVEWIDLESRRCKTTGGYESDIDDFEFIDSRDYDELRGEYAGRAMQTLIPTIGNQDEDEVLKAMKEDGCDSFCEYVARKAVDFADALIYELKRPKDYKEMFGVND